MIAPLLLAAALPGLFVDADPAPERKTAGIDCVSIPPARAEAWKGQCAKVVDPASLTKLPAPGVRYRMNEARASSAPWIDTNGARFARGLPSPALITVTAGKAALAAAEAHAFGADALITAPPAEWPAFAAMNKFLATLPAEPLPALANIGFVDDGTGSALENMKLMLRRNILFRVVSKPDKTLDLHVASKKGDPSAFAHEVRYKLTDAKRLLRVYGSEVVVARLFGDATRRRVALLNYGNRVVEGVRVRVLGRWPKITTHVFGETVEATDLVVEANATEFSLTRVPAYAVIELAQ